MKKKTPSSAIEISQEGASIIEIVLRDPEGRAIERVQVNSPSRWEQWLGVSWEDKVLKVFSRLDAKRSVVDQGYREGEGIVSKLGTDLGQEQ